MEGLAGYVTASSSSSSSSSSDEEDDATSSRGPQSKRPRVSLELRAHELRRSTVSEAFRTRDDPSQNDGRTRQFGHEPGNWSTFVCVPVEPHEELERWVSTIIKCADTHCARESSGGETPQWRRVAQPDSGGGVGHNRGDYSHVSLSRTFPLRLPDIVPFREALEMGVNAYVRSAAGESCFTLPLERLKLFTNEDRSRSFISLCTAETDRGSDHQARLVRLIHEAIDPACISVGAPKFYEPAEPHLSVVWTLGDATASVAIAELQAEVESSLTQQTSSGKRLVDGVVVQVDRVVTTSGNMQKTFPLRS
jgi:hypothetical protein